MRSFVALCCDIHEIAPPGEEVDVNLSNDESCIKKLNLFVEVFNVSLSNSFL